ncbi:MAG: sulfite exporter TauE/SafE family protein [Vulcanimicrobiota bacterium]
MRFLALAVCLAASLCLPAWANGDHRELAELIHSGAFLPVVLTSAFVLGALHGLSPGHGKTVVGAYLIGSKGTLWHALVLGLVVTFTHTFSVLLLGAVSLFFFDSVVPARATQFIQCASGLLISLVGCWLLRQRLLPAGGGDDPWPDHGHSHHGHGHSHSHDDHGHSHSHADHAHEPYGHNHGAGWHTHEVPEKLTLPGLISLGISGGLTPCPDAILVLLSALALHKLAIGMLVLLFFSAGLAFILVLIGFLMVLASRFFEKKYPSPGLINKISNLSYLFVIAMGLAIAFSAFRGHS